MTAAEMLTAVKNLCSISSTTHDTFLLQEINFGQADFFRDINWAFLEKKGSLAAVANQYIYDLASDFDTIKAVTFKQKHYLKPVSYDQWIELNRYESSGTPRWYIIHEGQLKIYPATGTAAPTTTLDGDINSSVATITLASVSDLKDRGRGLIGTEVVDWQTVDSTNVQIQLCTRGVEGTTAASASDGDTFTYRQLEYSYYKTLADLASNDTSEIPARYHEAMVLYAAGRFFEKIENEVKANNLFERYYMIKNQALKDLGEKISQRFSTTLEDTMPRISYRDETYPDNGSLTAA